MPLSFHDHADAILRIRNPCPPTPVMASVTHRSNAQASVCRSLTCLTYSSLSFSQSSAAWPFSGLALCQRQYHIVFHAKQHPRIRFLQQALNSQQYTLHIIHSTPLVLQDIQAYPARHVDVRVVDWCLELRLRWSVGVVVWEVEGELEFHAGVAGVWWALEGSSPLCEVGVVVWEGADVAVGGHHHGAEFCL